MLTKEEIIKAVQRWARENRRTPSEKIIREELRIPKLDWINYWTKITDLQREAGLAPQGFDKTKYTKKDLCDEFIKFIREIKKWPSRDELDYKRRHNLNFPASGTFYDTLGKVKTGDLPQAILDYIDNKQDYEDISHICSTVLKHHQDISEISKDNQLEHGFVYLGKRGSHYRIGRTKDLDQRRNDHNINQPEYFEYIYAIETDDMVHIENYWHKRFELKKITGEWFKLNSSDVKAFKRWRIF